MNPTSDPTHEVLLRLERRLESIERRLDILDTVSHHAPALVAGATDSFDELMREASARGLDLQRAVDRTLELVLTLARPDSIAALESLVAHLPTLQQAIDLFETMPDVIAATTDAADELVAQAMRQGIDPSALLRNGVMVIMRLGRLVDSPEFAALLDSGMLEPRAVGVLGRAATALADARPDGGEAIGLFALLRALRDPDVQSTVRFGLSVARGFGAGERGAPRLTQAS